jgi:hypothetical protein
MKNIFSNKAPGRDGSIRFTVEYDATFVRNMFKNIRDGVYDLPNIVKFVAKTLAQFDDFDAIIKAEIEADREARKLKEAA